MIFRFSLYGFLKNLRFFEPFFLLFLKEKGLSFTEIGLLISFREICVNILNIPTGAIADLYGRKRSMLVSFTAYLISFVLFYLAKNIGILFAAMFLFGIGESFRSGTHKAMIFDYLRLNNMIDKKTKIYGFTRSWSQKGSALSVLIGAVIVYFGATYNTIFLFSIIPYLLGIINIATYPDYLDKKNETGESVLQIAIHLKLSLLKCYHDIKLRKFLIQSSIFEGQFRSVKDYLQILIQNFALTLPILLTITTQKKTAILIGLIYFALYLLTSIASRSSHLVVKFCNGYENAISTILWLTTALLLLCSLNITPLAIMAMIIIFNLQNIFRPIMMAQFDDLAESAEQATILSIESQANSIGILLTAPIIGYLSDKFGIQYGFLFCFTILFSYQITKIIFDRQH